jgi:hypothetical protein
MRDRKMDPYAAARLRFMRETAPWRSQLRRVYRRRLERRYFAELPARLRALWQRKDRSMAEKRRLLFALWEECLEPGVLRDQQLAQQARWMIRRFIQARVPASSPHRFTAAELAGWNSRRRGKIRFDPYGRLRRPRLRDAVPAPGRPTPTRAAPDKPAPARPTPARPAPPRPPPGRAQ